MNKIDFVTREVFRIVTENSVPLDEAILTAHVWNLRKFNTVSGRHEIECFFAIEFEQEQVDAWTTVQNIIDDVMNLWVSPITDPVVKGANLETVQRLQRQLGESQAAFNERVLTVVDHAYQKNPLFVDVPENPPITRINRITREDVEIFRDEIDLHPDCFEYPNALIAYQRIATKSAIYPGKGTPFGLMYAVLGLAEAGEVQNKVKKAFRDDGVISFHPDETVPDRIGRSVVSFQPVTPERRAQIIKELGGALWYIAAVCDEIGATMSEVALQNLDELCGRGERNTLRGDGDNR